MPGMNTQAATLDDIAQLLDQQAQAVLDGHADALPALARALNAQLARLVAEFGRSALPPSERVRLRELHTRVWATLEMLNRRLRDTQRSLDALSRGNAVLQAAQANRVYAAAGQLAAPAWRSQALARA